MTCLSEAIIDLAALFNALALMPDEHKDVGPRIKPIPKLGFRRALLGIKVFF